MQNVYIQDKIFNKEDYTNNPLTKARYENCIFNNCNFAECNLSDLEFTECEFNTCNLSLAKLNKASFREVKFKDSKLLGLRFDNCNEFGLSFSFENCQLSHSSFYKTNVKKTVFKSVLLQEV